MNKNIVKMLIPLVAVVVVVESVVLVSRLNASTTQNTVVENTVEQTKEEVVGPVADFVFETDSKEMKVGKSYVVNLSLIGKEVVNLDAIETYVKYDPKMLTVSKLTFGKNLPVVTEKSKIDYIDTGIVNLIAFWENEGKNYSVKPDNSEIILSFTVTPKLSGNTEISLAESSDIGGYSTLLVENGTSNQLSFLNNKLEINVIN